MPSRGGALAFGHDYEDHPTDSSWTCNARHQRLLRVLVNLHGSPKPYKTMKKITLFSILFAFPLGFSSCSMFGMPGGHAGTITETHQVKTCRYDTVTEQVLVSSSAKGGNVYETVETKTPRYRTVTRKTRVPCGSCTRLYVVRNGCCGTTSEKTRKIATAQSATGSPPIGLIPTMRPLVD